MTGQLEQCDGCGRLSYDVRHHGDHWLCPACRPLAPVPRDRA